MSDPRESSPTEPASVPALTPPTPPTPHSAHSADRAVSRFALVGLIAPAVLGLAAAALQLYWLPQLPNPAATHWGFDGQPDGFAAPITYPILTAAVAFLLPAAMSASVLPSMRRGARGPSFRFMAATAAGMSAMFAVGLTAAVALQRGLPDATGAPDVGGMLLAGLAAGLVAGVAGWFAQPKQRTQEVGGAPSNPVTLAEGERAVWLRTATAPVLMVVALIAVELLLIAVAILLLAAADPLAWLVIGIAAVVVLATAALVRFHIRADHTGLTVTSALGWPRVHVPVEDIESVTVADVNPIGEFGGWGWRIGIAIDGRRSPIGIILRSGPALRVRRRAGRDVVVAVDDAATGAGVLTAYLPTTTPPANSAPDDRADRC